MSDITVDQTKKIWSRAAEIGLSEDDLRDLIEEISGQRSVRGLTKEKAGMVIDVLEGKAAKRREPVPKGNPDIINLATPDQISYAEDLKEKAGWDDDHLKNFIRKTFKKTRLRKLKNEEIGVIIHVLEEAVAKKKGEGV